MCEVEEQAVVIAQEAKALAEITLQLANTVLMLCRSMGGNQRKANTEESRRYAYYVNVLREMREMEKDCAKRLDAAILKLTK